MCPLTAQLPITVYKSTLTPTLSSALKFLDKYVGKSYYHSKDEETNPERQCVLRVKEPVYDTV